MMLRPTKHSHPDKTIINLSLILIKNFKKKSLVEYGELQKIASSKVSGGDILFLPTLNFLYLMGLIEYRPKTDRIEYVGPK